MGWKECNTLKWQESGGYSCEEESVVFLLLNANKMLQIQYFTQVEQKSCCISAVK